MPPSPKSLLKENGPESSKAQSFLQQGLLIDAQLHCYSGYARYPAGTLIADKDSLFNILESLSNHQPPLSTADFSVSKHVEFLKTVERDKTEHLYYRGRAAHLLFSALFRAGKFTAGAQELRNAVAFWDLMLKEGRKVVEGEAVDPWGNVVDIHLAVCHPEWGLLTSSVLLLDNIEGRT